MRAPFLRHAHSRGLAARVNTRICSPGAHDRDWCSTQFGHRPFELALNRPFVRLPLPAGKARAIVVQHELHGTRQHPREISPGRLTVKERNPLNVIDFRLSARQCGLTREPRFLSR